MLLIGIDVGGTHTKFGLIEDNKIIRSMKLSTNTFDVIKQIVNGARELVQSDNRTMEEVQGIAIGFPGMIVNSVILDSPNIGLQNCNIQEILSEEFNLPIVVKNDAEMATLAEHKLGAGENCDNMVLITLGTGVGGGIIVNKNLYEGNGGAGELGHIIIEHNGRECSCGRRGCAEQYISMIALEKLAKDTMVGYPNTCITTNSDGNIYATELMRAYKRNDACAKEVIDKYVQELTSYVLNLCNLFRPEKLVIGGGVTHAPEIIDMVAKACKEQSYGYINSPKVDIVPATLGNDAGMLGAVVCFESLDNTQNETQTESVIKSNIIEPDVEQNTQDIGNYTVEQNNEDLLSDFINASKEPTIEETEEEIVYDDDLINRINELLKKKD